MIVPDSHFGEETIKYVCAGLEIKKNPQVAFWRPTGEI